MRYFSTFTGIGGMERGIIQAYENINRRGRHRKASGVDHRKNAGATGRKQNHAVCVGYSEIDKYAAQIYQSHYPKHKNYGDITKIDAHDLPDFDMLIGGFPCQSFSIAGKRKGFEDTRGTLFFDLARILRAKRPRLFLFENVKGLLSHDNGRTFSIIIATLDDLGYDLQWQVLNSKDFGIAQNRERIFIVGHIRGSRRPSVFPFFEANESGDGSDTPEKAILAGALTARQFANWSGNYVKQIATINKGQSGRVYSPQGIAPTLSTMTGGGLKQPKILTRARGNNKGGVLNSVSPTLGARSWDHNNHLVAQGGVRRLTPIECERLQGFPDNWTAGVSDTQRYKTLGNAVTVNVIQAIIERMI